MVLIKSKPETFFNESLIPQSFNSLFNAFFDDSKLQKTSMAFMPQADVLEKEHHYEIHLALPGMKKEDIKISVDGDMLNIEGERKAEVKEETEKFVRRETSYGKFSRSFNVSKLNTSEIQASFENGILNVQIPKAKVEKASTIEIK